MNFRKYDFPTYYAVKFAQLPAGLLTTLLFTNLRNFRRKNESKRIFDHRFIVNLSGTLINVFSSVPDVFLPKVRTSLTYLARV